MKLDRRTESRNRRARIWIALAPLLLLAPPIALAGLSVQGLSVQGLSVQGLSVQGLSVQGLSVQGLSVQGLSVQGLSVQGLSVQGLSVQGLSVQGLSVQGLSVQGLSVQGLSVQGLSVQGLSVQGLSVQGLSVQGLSVQGVPVMGTDVVADDLKGVDIASVDIRGTTSDSTVVPFELTSGAGMSTGAGSYISVGGASAVGHYATAHLADPAGNPAEDLDLFIAGERPDPVPNLLHRAESQDNEDVTLYEVFYFNKWSGQWASLCPIHAATGAATAMALAEDPAHPSKFAFACTASGVASKCARIWGYRPWRTETTWVFDDGLGDWVEKSFDMRPFYEACKLAARAGYCQDRQSFTKNGTLVDLFDTRQLIWPNAIENPLSDLNDDSRWMFAQEYFVSFDTLASNPDLRVTALQRTRYRDLSPVGQCAAFADISRLERDHFEDGRFANPLVGTPRIEVFSPNSCTHDESELGEALPWDCSPCTTAICAKYPQCCSADPMLPQPVWGPACQAARLELCQDVPGGGGPWWPLGKVWPRDVPKSTDQPQKYLIGPGGAVDRVEGVSTTSTSATLQGWACDPEWPGAAVSLEIYGGAPREHGGTHLGTVYADEALAAPLAAEVGAACDRANAGTARHGFSFALPVGTSGNVFVYALDAATADGPAAPPTLLRNGIVHVPTCAHSEHVAGGALDASCSPCAGSVCAQGGLGACCTTAWTDECAAAAESCEPADASAVANERAFAQVLTGWIEAPASGSYVFRSAAEPSRLFVNGKTLVDWWDGPGATSGNIELQAGARYQLRWDRFQASPPGSPGDPGLTWQPPGAASQQPIPAGNLYRVGPGMGTGLQATYFDNPGFAGASSARVDAAVAQSAATVLPPGVLPPTYSVIWEGEIVPTYSDSYTFTLVAAGDATVEVGGSTVVPPIPSPTPPLSAACALASHDLCALGDKLTKSTITLPACDSCVDQICAKDPFCCNGGYLSYYSTEPVWDARCVTEVATVCGLDCKNPLPSATTQARAGTAVALKAGVRTPIRVKVKNVSTVDPNVSLIWASERQPRGPVPTGVLYPPSAPVGRGAGLNLVSFATKNGGTKPDLDTPLAAGAAPDVALAPAAGPTGLPLVDVLASPSDPALGKPASPLLVRPWFGAHVFSDAPAEIPVFGMGGVRGGSVLAHVEGTAIDVLMPVASDGTFSGTIPVGAFGAYTLRLVQRNFPGGTCTSPPAVFCAESPPLAWDVSVTERLPAGPPPPVITSPRDPTASPNPADDTFVVTGTANPGTVNVCDEGTGVTLTPTLVATGEGKLSGSVKLSAGSTSDPAKGWHKLVFSNATCPPGASGSHPVFVSVGIRPPTVEFPRTGAEIDCRANAPDPSKIDVKGRIPYAEARFGKLRIAEETGRASLLLINRDVAVDQNQQPDGSFLFNTSLALGPGKHLVYFFQAPEPPPNATPAERDAHFRAYASIANTPTSRLEVRVPPPRLQFPIRAQGFVTTSPFKFGAADCAPGQTGAPGCALPNADVNVRVGARVWTVRADALGRWNIEINLPPGWHDMRISQVADTRVGGGWQEGCPNDDTTVGIVTPDEKARPKLDLPGPFSVEATKPAGAVVTYGASAVTERGTPAIVECNPSSGATFRVGATPVFCVAVDPETHAVALGGFTVTVTDGPPLVKVPKGLVAEAQSSFGALVSYEASAADAVSGDLPVECVPASPALFPLDEVTLVSCAATDGAGQTTVESFPVRVQDTTPPTMCPLHDVRLVASGPSGGRVFYPTCADDLVDGPVAVSCDHASGSFFAVGRTVVTCAATDRHGNGSPAASFVVDVGDGAPPVLKLPGTIEVAATSRLGAVVAYVATAVDDVDPHPVVSCSPPSGSRFPLGSTPVTCSATDASGNRATGTFTVRVVVVTGGFLPPLNPAGTSVFFRPLAIPVRFALAGASAPIRDLPARLFLARINATGGVGPEQPAAGLPPFLGNAFVYNPLLREYDLLLDTRLLAAGAWRLRVDLGDGVPHTVKITLR